MGETVAVSNNFVHGDQAGEAKVSRSCGRLSFLHTGRGLNNIEIGIRLRYELKRQFAPYIGISFDRSFFGTADFVRQDGGNPRQIRFVAGVRLWH